MDTTQIFRAYRDFWLGLKATPEKIYHIEMYQSSSLYGICQNEEIPALLDVAQRRAKLDTVVFAE